MNLKILCLKFSKFIVFKSQKCYGDTVQNESARAKN